MSAPWSPNAICDRDQILAMLRDAREPMTSTDIASQMVYTSVSPCDGGQHCRAPSKFADEHTEHLASGKDQTTRPSRTSDQSNRDLEAMMKLELVTRDKRGRRVVWSAALGDLVSLSAMPELEASS